MMPLRMVEQGAPRISAIIEATNKLAKTVKINFVSTRKYKKKLKTTGECLMKKEAAKCHKRTLKYFNYPPTVLHSPV